jgi:hypothetical protein
VGWIFNYQSNIYTGLQLIFPNNYFSVGSLPMLRHIFKRESIQIVHGHAAFSALAHEALFVGNLMGLGKYFYIISSIRQITYYISGHISFKIHQLCILS